MSFNNHFTVVFTISSRASHISTTSQTELMYDTIRDLDINSYTSSILVNTNGPINTHTQILHSKQPLNDETRTPTERERYSGVPTTWPGTAHWSLLKVEGERARERETENIPFPVRREERGEAGGSFGKRSESSLFSLTATSLSNVYNPDTFSVVQWLSNTNVFLNVSLCMCYVGLHLLTSYSSKRYTHACTNTKCCYRLFHLNKINIRYCA